MPSANCRTFSSCFLSCLTLFRFNFDSETQSKFRLEILLDLICRCFFSRCGILTRRRRPRRWTIAHSSSEKPSDCQTIAAIAKIWQVHQFTLKVLWHSDIWLVFHQQQEVVCRKLEVPAQSSLNQKYSSCENQNFMAKSYCNWPHLVTNKGLCSTHFTHLRCYILPPALLFCSALCLRRLANSNLDTLLSSIPA